MRADIGIAMGGVGSDAAIEASDIVLMQDDLRGLPLAKRIARKTMAVVKENIAFSLLVRLSSSSSRRRGSPICGWRCSATSASR